MPRYEFMCEKCQRPFELTITIGERQKATVKCPKCRGTKVVPQLASFMTQTSKKSWVVQTAEMNDETLFTELLRVAEALDAIVRVEPFETPARAGGESCILRGSDGGAPHQIAPEMATTGG
jgi:putative FmdB family regulatory protein